MIPVLIFKKAMGISKNGRGIAFSLNKNILLVIKYIIVKRNISFEKLKY